MHRRLLRWSGTAAVVASSSVALLQLQPLALAKDPSSDDKFYTRTRNFSFSGAGFLLSYHLGVAKELQLHGYLTDRSKVAGASGGAITALSIVAKKDIQEIQDEVKNMAKIGHEYGTVGKLEPRLRHIFNAKFGGIKIEDLNNRLTIATQRVWPPQDAFHCNEFLSPEDLCDAIIASCYVPYYLSGRGATEFRGELHMDGGLWTLVPEIEGYVKVCALPASRLGRPDYEISPSIDEKFPYSVLQLGAMALLPPESEVLDELFDLGRRSARIWVEQQEKMEIEKKKMKQEV